MSGRDINELIVALRPVGTDETTDALEDAQESFEETADTAEESSDDLEAFSDRFTGAMAVATTALSVAAGGLLSTVPIIGEAFAGIGAIIQSLGLRIDGFLRRLGFSTDGLFRFANAIAAAEGPTARFLDAILTLTAGLAAVVAGVGAVAVATGNVGAVMGAVSGAIATVIGAVSALTVGIAALAILMGGFAVAWITDWNGIRTTTMDIVNSFVDFTIGRFQDLMQIAQLMGQRIKIIFQGWTNAAHRLVVKAMNGIISAVESAINGIISTINRFSNLTGISLGTVSLERMAVPDRRQTASRLTRNRQAVNSILDRQQGASQQLAQDIADAIGGELPDEIRAVLNIDGREAAQATDRWRGTNVANKGR